MSELKMTPTPGPTMHDPLRDGLRALRALAAYHADAAAVAAIDHEIAEWERLGYRPDGMGARIRAVSGAAVLAESRAVGGLSSKEMAAALLSRCAMLGATVAS